MGRSWRDRRKSTGVSEEKEQKKIRDKILKVFQARLSSPGQGGALYVAEPRKTEKQKPAKERKSKHRVVVESTSTDDSSCGSMSGRGRKRTKSESLSRRKSRKSTKNKREVEKDTAVSKHLRVAHGITGQQQAGMKNDVRGRPTMYSHSRITQKAGLISTGTKGAPASRGIAVPEHISKQTEEEIRKMSEEAEADVHMTGDIDVAEKLVLSRGSVSSCARKSETPASVDMRPHISACNSVERMRERQSPYGVDSGKFPEILPVKETVASLMSSLKYHTKSLYPGRDYLRETHDELLKLVKQNAPRSATPTRLPVFSTITRSGSVRRPLVESFTSEDSDGHYYSDNKRNVAELVDRGVKDDYNLNLQNEHAYSFNDQISLVPRINFTDVNPFQVSNGERGKSYLENRHLPSRGLSSIKRTREQPYNKIEHDHIVQKDHEKSGEIESLHHLYSNSRLLEHRRKKVQNEIRTYIDSQKRDRRHDIRNGDLGIKGQFSDLNDFFARRKLEEDDYFFSGNGPHVSKMPKSPVLRAHAKLVMPRSPMLSWEATSLLQANEESNCNREIFEPMDIDTKGAEAVNLLQQNDLLKDGSEQEPYIHPDTRDYDTTLDWVNGQSRSNSQCSHCSQGSADHISQVQVPTRQSNYMPSFHGNYYADHMATGDLSWQQKNHRVKVEAMDILDYVDQYIGRDSYMDCRGDRTNTLRVHTPESAGSPVWRVSDHILRRKNLLPTSPKSPGCPKFYPKKMY